MPRLRLLLFEDDDELLVDFVTVLDLDELLLCTAELRLVLEPELMFTDLLLEELLSLNAERVISDAAFRKPFQIEFELLLRTLGAGSVCTRLAGIVYVLLLE